MNPIMNTDQNKATYRSFIQIVFNEGRLDAVEEYLSPKYVLHDARPGTLAGREGVKQIVSIFRAAFPDLNITIEDQVAEQDKVCSLTTMRGTHKGSLFGIAPTGRTVTVTGLTMVRILGGRIVESWVKNDETALMNQLGAGPDAASGKPMDTRAQDEPVLTR